MGGDPVELIWSETCLSLYGLIALYLFQAKEVTHLWELGGGTSLSMLADVPITAHSIRYIIYTLEGRK